MERKNVLIAVDSSENSKRAVSYVGEMLGESPGVRICLLYVEKPPNRDRFATDEAWKQAAQDKEQRLRSFLGEAKTMLRELGIPDDGITEEYVVSCSSPLHESTDYCTPGTSIAQEILRVQEKGGYGTIVIGRRGVSRTEEFLFGSVSTSVMQNATNGTIWVVE
jgi:nucleotide-binding universal stress UspA family protein